MSDRSAGPSFVDTNVLVYAIAGDDPRRSPVAQELLLELVSRETLRTSTQVLQELFVTLTRKIRKPFAQEQALRYMDQLAEFPVVLLDYDVIRTAARLATDHSFSFWDGLVVVAAARSGASQLYTEDLQDGQRILGLQIINPFK